MSEQLDIRPLQFGEAAPNFVLDAITREGKIAIDDFRGERPVLVGLYRGLHCPFCRRHIATLSQLTPALNAKGIENFTGQHACRARASLSPVPSDGRPTRGIRPGAGIAPRLWPTEYA